MLRCMPMIHEAILDEEPPTPGPRRDREYLTAREVGQIRKRSEPALVKERRQGKGPPWVRDNRRILYPAEEFWEYMAALTADNEEED